MQVDPAVGERVLVGLWGTEESVSKQELEGRPSCTSSRSPGHSSAGVSVVMQDPAGTLAHLFLGRAGMWSVTVA